MSLKLNATSLKETIQNSIEKEVASLFEKVQIRPKLVLIRVGRKAEDLSYEKVIYQSCRKTNIECQTIEMALDISQTDLEQHLINANNDSTVHGIMVFRPLPEHLDIDRLSRIIDPIKDADCMSYQNLERLFTNRDVKIMPCTALAALKLLEYYQVELKGKNVCVVGASMVVGKPLAMLLLEQKATVTITHIYTRNLKEITSQADIVIIAIGQAKFFTRDYFNSESIVIDIGVSLDQNNQHSGDVDFTDVENYVKAITPLKHGVGDLTTSLLLNNSRF